MSEPYRRRTNIHVGGGNPLDCSVTGFPAGRVHLRFGSYAPLELSLVIERVSDAREIARLLIEAADFAEGRS